MALNVDAAILGHSQWKSRLSVYLKNPDQSMNPAVVQKTDECVLGKWLATEGARELSNADLTALQTAHAVFHREASDVVRRANSGLKVNEEVAIGARSPFSHATMQVVQLLTKLRK